MRTCACDTAYPTQSSGRAWQIHILRDPTASLHWLRSGRAALFANVIGITSESDFSSPYIIGYLHVQVSDRQSQLADDRVLRTRVFYADAFCSLPPWMRC